MKKKSPLAMMKNCKARKIQKFSEGGGVFGEYQELYDQPDRYNPAGDWSDADIAALDMDNLNDAEMDSVFNAIGQGDYNAPGDSDGEFSIQDLLAMLGGNLPQQDVNAYPPVPLVVAPEGMMSRAPTQAVQQAQEKPEKNWFTSKNWDGSDTPKPSTGGLSADEVAKLTPSEKLQYMTMQRMFAPKEEPSNWQKLLQLGMVGIGGLTSYKDAQAKNKALKQAYGKVDEREAAAQRHFGNVNRSGSSYAYNTPAINQFRRPT
jgi:hypothetical protein